MTREEYVHERLNDQICWYDDKSQWNRKWYKALQIVQILGAALIPFLVGRAGKVRFWEVELEFWEIAVGVLGVIVALATGLQGLYRFQELWIEYRTTAESLKHEKYLFLTQTAPYDKADEEAFALLVQNVEDLISQEHSKWRRSMREARKEAEERQRGAT